MSLLKDFERFAVKGNAMDMAIGVIMGTAFGKIVSSLVDDIIMPPIGKLLGSVRISNQFISLSKESFPTIKAAHEVGVPTLNYGLFLQNCFDFLIVAFSIFIAMRAITTIRNRYFAHTIDGTSAKKPDERLLLLREIRDSLKTK
ncbi:MAG: large conductance mechanosensitive channel protein MscL [Deltaproteobacteria bacterium]|nr:large conductance mechanosensitive channel protein MscL [Deltaproteobacteria bacterium]